MLARHQHYSAVVSALEGRVAQLPEGAERDRSAARLAAIKSDFDGFSGLLAGTHPGGGAMRFLGAEQDTIEMQRLSERMRQGVSELALEHPEALSRIPQFQHRQSVAENMVAKLAQDQLAGLDSLPIEAMAGRTELLGDLKESAGWMKGRIGLSKEEAALQGRVLEPLGAALTGAGQAEVDGSLGLGHKVGKVIGHGASEALGIDARRPNERVSDQINDSYGHFVHATPDGKKNFELAPDVNALGRLSTQGFLGSLDAGLGRKSEGLGLNVVSAGTEMAVEASEDLKLVGRRPGEPKKTSHATLAPQTAAHLEALRRKTGAPEDVAPLDRLTGVGRRAAEEHRLGDLKTSLVQSFGPGITRQEQGADSLLQARPGLAGAKASLLEATMGELMTCRTREEMLDTIGAARMEHQAILGEQVFPARGGRTATALDEMEQAINRFFAG